MAQIRRLPDSSSRPRRSPSQQLRQLGDVGGDAAGLVAGEQLSSRTATRVILAIDEGQRLFVGVAHNEARGSFLDGPWPRKAQPT